MRTDVRTPLDGGAVAIFIVVALFALLCVLRLNGIDTEIRPLDTAVSTFLRTVGIEGFR